MAQMVRMRLSPSMPEAMRKRMSYRTRMLTADDADVVEASPNDARFLRRLGWADDEPEQIDEIEPVEEAVPEPTRAELIARAEELGLELPAGYVRKDELARMIAEAEPVEDEGGDA